MRTIFLPGVDRCYEDESLDATLSIVLPLTAIELLLEEGGSRISGRASKGRRNHLCKNVSRRSPRT